MINEQREKGAQHTEMTKKYEIANEDNKTLRAKLEIQN
jgi:hypothetical protein